MDRGWAKTEFDELFFVQNGVPPDLADEPSRRHREPDRVGEQRHRQGEHFLYRYDEPSVQFGTIGRERMVGVPLVLTY